ncbi:MAG: hypothetical protein JST73_03310, partial [Actinobacteria bacterium]|nr:hypothetical protein [Actinomycetota bacterium]
GWNPGGIWRPARIRRTGPVAITTHRVLCTAATTERATVTISCVFDSDAPLDATLRTTIAGIDDERTRRLAVGPNAITWAIDIPDPPLWWPRELGDQPLVDVTVTVSTVDATDTDATPSDSFTRRCGLRSVEVCDWILRVNGERLFAKGVLVGPAAHDLGTAPPESFTRQIARAHDAGCNLVRVHSHISRDELYDAADEHGMLLWQDLPLYRGQHRSVRSTAIRTARAAVDRLGAHPSIILWCGHDEPDHPGTTAPARRFTRRLAAHELPNWNRSVLDPSVKRALSTADPSRPTIASSGTWPRPPKLAGSDTHLGFGWSTGTVDDLERLARAMPRSVRFVQITPNPTMLRAPELQPPSRWPPTDPTDLVEGDTGTTDIGLLAARVPPDAFLSAEQWHRATLNHQAMLIRTQIEVLRRLKYRPTGGFVIAHLDDIRPAVSTSLIAYDGAPKPAFDALQLACTPILVTLDRWPECAHPGDELDCDVHIVNDTRAPLTAARIDVRLRWTDGDRVHGGATWAFEGDTAADSVELVGRIRAEIPAGVDRVTAELRLSTSTGEHQFHYGAPVHTDHDHD